VETKYRPALYYYIFGVESTEVTISGKRHQVTEIPRGMEYVIIDRDQHQEYMDAALADPLGKLLRERDPELFETVRKTERWAFVRGEIPDDADLHYLRNAIGIIRAFLDGGAVAVLDLQTFTLYSAAEFTDRFFGKPFNGFDHVAILTSDAENGELWLHTRGMRKFGRPDVSIEHVDPEELPWAVGVAKQLIYYGVEGAFFAGKRVKLHISPEEAFLVSPELVDDPDNDDFNNVYYQLLWEDCARLVP
jgi:hypothetical protein